MPETAPEMLMNFLRTLKDDDFIINVSTSSVDQRTTQSTAIDNNVIDETNQLLDELYLIVVRNNNLSEADQKMIEKIVNNVRELIIKIYSSLNERISSLNDRIMVLEKRNDFLENKQKENKRVNIISEIFITLKKTIYNEMLNKNIPAYYYNENILKALDSLNKDNIESSNFYTNVHKMTNQFDEAPFYLLRELIYSLSVSQNMNYDVLLNLLIEKERRNFEEYSFVTDFIKDSFRTNDARFTTLLRQQGLLTEFQLSEIDVLDKTYMKYFGYLHRQN